MSHEDLGIDVVLVKEYEQMHKEGDVALFFAGEAEGAIPNGSRIEKCNTEASDSFPDGTMGTVMSSHETEGVFVYFISWDPKPGVPVAIHGKRIKLSPGPQTAGTHPHPSPTDASARENT